MSGGVSPPPSVTPSVRSILPVHTAERPIVDIDGELEPTRPVSIVARRRLGETGFAVYPVALGTSSFGWTTDEVAAFPVLDRFRESGGNLIDTADNYAGGESEAIIGRWMRERGNRDELVISTKVGKGRENPGLGPVSVVRAVEASLRRLRIDRIDLLSFHLDDPDVPLDESLATVEWLIAAGKVAALGAVGFSADRLLEARILSSSGLPKVFVAGTDYTLMHRSPYESGVQLAASAQGLAVMPCSDLGSRLGLGRKRAETGPLAVIARATDPVARRSGRVFSALHKIAAEHRSAPAAVAIAWLLTKRNVVAPVVGLSHESEVDSVMGAAAIRLTRAQVLDLDRASS